MNSGIYLWLAGLSKTLLEGAFYTQGTLIKAVLKGVCSAPPPPPVYLPWYYTCKAFGSPSTRQNV